MKAATSVVLLLAALSAGAVGVGYLVMRRHGQEPAQTATPGPVGAATPSVTPPTPAPATPLPAIAVGEPAPNDGGRIWMGGTPPDIFDETRPAPMPEFVQAGAAVSAPVPASIPAPTSRVIRRASDWLEVIRQAPPVTRPVEQPQPAEFVSPEFVSRAEIAAEVRASRFERA